MAIDDDVRDELNRILSQDDERFQELDDIGRCWLTMLCKKLLDADGALSWVDGLYMLAEVIDTYADNLNRFTVIPEQPEGAGTRKTWFKYLRWHYHAAVQIRHPNRTLQDVADEVGYSRRTAEKWSDRFVHHLLDQIDLNSDVDIELQLLWTHYPIVIESTIIRRVLDERRKKE